MFKISHGLAGPLALATVSLCVHYFQEGHRAPPATARRAFAANRIDGLNLSQPKSVKKSHQSPSRGSSLAPFSLTRRERVGRRIERSQSGLEFQKLAAPSGVGRLSETKRDQCAGLGVEADSRL